MLNCGEGTHLKKILSFWPSCQSRCGSRSYHSNLNYVCGCTASAAWCSSKVELRYEISMPALRRFDKCALPVRPLRPPWTCQEERLLPDSWAGSSFRCLMMFVTFVHNWWLLHIVILLGSLGHTTLPSDIWSLLQCFTGKRARRTWTWTTQTLKILALFNFGAVKWMRGCARRALLLRGGSVTRSGRIGSVVQWLEPFSWYLLFDMCFINLLLLFR
jgi:hypothetical protein